MMIETITKTRGQGETITTTILDYFLIAKKKKDVSLSNISTNETFFDWPNMHISNKVVITMSPIDAITLSSLPFHHQLPTILIFQHPIIKEEEEDDNEGPLFKITNLFLSNQ